MNSIRFFAIILVILPICGIQGTTYSTTSGKNYNIYTTAGSTWNDANMICSNQEMALVTLDSKEKMDDLFSLFTQKIAGNEFYLWVGCVGAFPEFHWLSNGGSTTPSLWLDRLHLSPNAYNCIVFYINLTRNKYGITNANCTAKTVDVICEDRVC